MPVQWSLFLSLVFALIVAIFSLSNVEEVPVNFLFTTATVPLILLILSSALAGATIVGLYGIFRQYKLQREIKRLNEVIEIYKEKSDDKKESVEAQTSVKPVASTSPTATESAEPSERVEGPSNSSDIVSERDSK
jgi:putative membrane protein